MADQLRERQDAAIWNAIEANNFKQALKLIDKRLAKRHTNYLEALKVYIRARSSQVPEKSAVLLHLEELTERKPPLSDLEAIELYDEALEEVLPESSDTWAKIIGQLRWQCVKAAPKNEDLGTKCFQACFSRGDLDHARQITNSLEKNFPQAHSYIYWNITTMFLFSISRSCPENQKKIWGGLALGQMWKLAGATKEAKNQKQLPTRSIQTPQELLLLDRITEVYGKSEQRLEYLQSFQLGPESIVAKGEWQLWRTRLHLMETAEKWQELFDNTGALLKRARTKDQTSQLSESRLSDWIVWEAYIRSAVELSGSQYKGEVQAEIEAHLDPASGIDKSWKRNASLARVKLIFESSTAFAGSQSFPDKVGAVVSYLQEYGKASTAYNDLRPFVEHFSPEERTQLLTILRSKSVFSDTEEAEAGQYPTKKDLSTGGKVTQLINTYKLRYLLTCTLPEYERSRSPINGSGEAEFKCTSCTKPCGLFCKFCLENAANEAVQSYRIAIDDDGRISKTLLSTDRHPADDLSILAAMCLIKLSLMGPGQATEPFKSTKTTYALQATVLLENAWSHSKHNFQISLLLVRLYSYLGCGSLAMRAYHRLALKQIQLDTLSYTLLDRISSLHPHSSSQSTEASSKQRTPLEHLEKQQKLYKSSREQIKKNLWLSFKHGSYNSIFEMLQVSEMLCRSMSAAMSVIESRKISRLTDPGTPLTEASNGFDLLRKVFSLVKLQLAPAKQTTAPDMEEPESKLSNTLDYESFPNFETSRGQRFEELSRYTPGLTDYRCRMNRAAEKLMLIVDTSSGGSGQKEMLHLWLKQYLDSQKKSKTPKVGSKGMTRSEEFAEATYHSMAVILRESHDREHWSQTGFQGTLDKHNKNLCESLEEHLALIESLVQRMPAFGSTLHALYTAHEVGRTVLNSCSYLSKQDRGFFEKQKEANIKIDELARKLLQVVVNKCADIKKGLDEGGWIDKVLECALPYAQDRVDGLVGESLPVVSSLRELLDENFLEEWAGEIVESWRDSVVGFSYLKVPSTKT